MRRGENGRTPVRGTQASSHHLARAGLTGFDAKGERLISPVWCCQKEHEAKGELFHSSDVSDEGG